jgi:hypothetical protein
LAEALAERRAVAIGTDRVTAAAYLAGERFAVDLTVGKTAQRRLAEMHKVEILQAHAVAAATVPGVTNPIGVSGLDPEEVLSWTREAAFAVHRAAGSLVTALGEEPDADARSLERRAVLRESLESTAEVMEWSSRVTLADVVEHPPERGAFYFVRSY